MTPSPTFLVASALRQIRKMTSAKEFCFVPGTPVPLSWSAPGQIS